MSPPDPHPSAAPSLEVAVVRLPHAEDLPLPAAATAGSAAVDLRAAVDAALTLEPGARAAVPTGLAIAVPPDHEAQVRARSGLALRHGVTVVNGVGTIDADYRGEVHALLINLGDAPFAIARGMRIAQLVIAPIVAPSRLRWRAVEALPPSARDAGGFGSTGVD
ncbi:MAG: dUTP diphosphatase [Acidobacteriota bacterium]